MFTEEIEMSHDTISTETNKEKRQLGTYLLKFGVPFVVSVGLCWLLFKNVDFGQMWHIIRTECNFYWIGLNLLLNVLAHVWRASRWKIQLDALGIKVSLWQLTLSIFGTYAVNLVFPRLGEVWRTGYISARNSASFTTVFGSMIAERLADMVTVASLLLFTFIIAGHQLSAYLSQNPEKFNMVMDLISSPVLWGGIVAVLVTVWWIFVKYPQNRVISIVRRIWSGLWEGFAVIAKMPGKGRWLLFTGLLWGSYFTALYCAFRAFPLTSEVITVYGFGALLVCFVMTSVSMGVPSNGGIGPWQWAMVFCLGFYAAGIPRLTTEYTVSFANLVMGVETLLSIILGLFTFGWIAVEKRSSKTVSIK